jgi:hypothetical protein
MCLRDPGKDASGHYHAHKLRDMMSYFDLQDYFAPLLETQASTIATTAADMVRYWDSIRQTIEQKMPQMRAAAEANLTLLECHQRNG